jgi:hypothetical protein
MMRIALILDLVKVSGREIPCPHNLPFSGRCFTRILIKAARKGYIIGFMDSLYPNCVISLQYVDDTLPFLKYDFRYACHLKWLMVCLEQLSGMKINYNKSEMTLVNHLEEESHTYSRIF